MNRMLPILIGVMVCLFLGSIVVLVAFFRSAQANTLAFEVAKALLQIGVVSIVGAIVSLLMFEYQRERQALDKERDQNQKDIEYREELVRSVLDRAMAGYSEVKKARRLLRARAIVNDGATVSAASYDSCLDMINNAQLALENLARDIKTSGQAFRAPGPLENDVWKMEHYLGEIITEYERSRGKFQGTPALLALSELPQLARFVAKAGDCEFKRALVEPFHVVQQTIRGELLHPKLPISKQVP